MKSIYNTQNIQAQTLGLVSALRKFGVTPISRVSVFELNVIKTYPVRVLMSQKILEKFSRRSERELGGKPKAFLEELDKMRLLAVSRRCARVKKFGVTPVIY